MFVGLIKSLLNSSLIKIALVFFGIVILANLFSSKILKNVDNFETKKEEEIDTSQLEQKMNVLETDLVSKISDIQDKITNMNNMINEYFDVHPSSKNKKQIKNKKSKKENMKKSIKKEESSDTESDDEEDKNLSAVEKFAQDYANGVSSNFVGDYMILDN